MDKLKGLLNLTIKGDSKKVKALVALGLAIIILIALSTISDSSNKNAEIDEKIDYLAYTESLENRLKSTISSINGVGRCRVMITLENSNESVYAINENSRNEMNSTNTSDEYVIYNSSNGESPVLIKEYFPKVQGVSVVCSGGDNDRVREEIIDTVSSLFNISSNRISVTKINE